MKRIEISGKRFGKLVAVRIAGSGRFDCGRPWRKWFCYCDCGGWTVAFEDNLKRGITKSCGCYAKQRNSEAHKTHGDSNPKNPHPLYSVWNGMKQRCLNPKSPLYPKWGGRGIKILWPDYESFRRDMGPTYQKGYSIERKDNDGPYSKGNCCWASEKQQALNRRNNRVLEFGGYSTTLGQWAERVGISKNTLWQRLNIGWSVEKALTTPKIRHIRRV